MKKIGILLVILAGIFIGTNCKTPGGADNVGPTAALTATPTTVNEGDSVSFDATGSDDADGSITEYAWDFDGDGSVDQTTTAATVTFTYSSAGTYEATVMVTDNDGLSAESSPVSITVHTSSSAPTADFTASSTTVLEGENVSLDPSASSDSDGTIDQYEWDFGDGSTDIQTSAAEVTHSYSSADTYTVTLTVTDNDGLTGQASVDITVLSSTSNSAPTAALTATTPTTITQNESVSFDASGSDDADGSITEYAWDFDGDGSVDQTTTAATVTYTYSSAGTYEATVMVTDNDGLSAESSPVTITVNAEPTASFTATSATTISEGDSVSFDASTSSDPDGSIVTYDWDFDGDGTVDQSNSSATVTHSYSAAGNYTVTLTVTDDDGYTAQSSEVSIIVKPIAEAGPDEITAYTDYVYLDGRSSSASHGIDAYSWDLDGDGSEDSSSAALTHLFEPGEHPVTLTISDINGNQDHDTLTVTAHNNPPFSGLDISSTTDGTLHENILYEVSSISTSSPVTVNFIIAVNDEEPFSSDFSNGESLQVDFGDGTSATSSNSDFTYNSTGDYFECSHEYTSLDTYKLTVTATDAYGEVGTLSYDFVITDASEGTQINIE